MKPALSWRARLGLVALVILAFALGAGLDRLASEIMVQTDLVASLLSPGGLTVGRASASVVYLLGHVGFWLVGPPMALAAAVLAGTWPGAQPK
jgi:hypothetical protein